jgi:UDP-N-acetylmuramate--alanine ligase
LGEGKYLVAEADDSDASFLYLQPMIAIVTNIDADHLSTYGGDFNRLRDTFIEFLHHLPFYGLAILCADDPQVKTILPQIRRPFLTYGTTPDCDVQASEICQRGMQTDFVVRFPDKKKSASFPITLNLPGKHSVLNSLAAMAVAWELGVTPQTMQLALAQFQGIGRRFHYYENLDSPAGRITLIDDYGHHPRELSAVLEAIRAGWPDRRLVLAFQPHRFTRTRDLFDDFAQVLSEPDVNPLAEVATERADGFGHDRPWRG